MAFQPTFKYYLRNALGHYYFAVQQPDSPGSYLIYTQVEPVALSVLPNGWDKLMLQWTRNAKWWGVFRTQTSTFKFVKDGRAILKTLLFGGDIDGGAYTGSTGIEAFCRLEIYRIKQIDFTYRLIYKSNINFALADDDEQNLMLSTPTLDSNLREKLDAFSGTNFNIPIWIPDGGGGWLLNKNDYSSGMVVSPVIVNNRGVKLLYQQQFTTGATQDVPYSFIVPAIGTGNAMQFSLSQLNLIQANGTPTVIGNHLLENTLLLGTQQLRVSNPTIGGGLLNFEQNSYCFWNQTGADVELIMNPQFMLDLKYPNPDTGDSPYPFVIEFHAWNIKQTVVGSVVSSVLDTDTEIGRIVITHDPSHGPHALVTINGYNYETQNKPNIPNDNSALSFAFATYNPVLSSITVKNGDMLALSIQCDIVIGIDDVTIKAYDLDFFCYSQPAFSGSAVQPSPALPDSTCIGFRPLDILKALTYSLFTTRTDENGMPDLTSTVDYNGEYADSRFLSNTHLNADYNYNAIPVNTIITCGNSLRNIRGIEYLSTSIDTFFKTMTNIYCLGLGINTVDGVDTIFVDSLNTFLNPSELMFDLGSDVYGLQIKPLASFAGNNIKTGFRQREANQDYGVDSFCVEQDYQTPITRVKQDIDMTISDNCDMYQIESARAEQNSKDQSSANSDNQTYLIYIENNPSVDGNIYDPLNNVIPFTDGYQSQMVGSGVQNTDPGAFSAKYVSGLLFPDTAVNLPLSPARCLLRNGALLSSIFDGLNAAYLTFRKQYQLLFNTGTNSGGYVPTLFPSVMSNLSLGGIYHPINEAGDIAISDLHSQWGGHSSISKLFRPFLISVTTKQPIDMYAIMNTSPYGYIQFNVDGKVYQGFIWDVEQKVGNESATTFTLLSHPDQTF